jgi:glycosyltransferase involved in cell wall biosynthesis
MKRETQNSDAGKISNATALVSIIIPCYNHDRFIEKALNSIIEDTYPHKEIIIINDGSKDNSDIKIRAWVSVHEKEEAVTYVNRANKGICATINEMIALAKGKYILPLASDDCLYGNAIARRVQILEERPDKSVLLNDALVIDDDDNIIMQSSSTDYWKADKSRYQNDASILKECIKGIKLGGPVILYRKDIFKEIGKFPEDLPIEDWYFYQRAASLNRIMFVDFKVALYRLHGENFSGVSTAHAVKLASHILKVYRLNFSFYPGIKYKLLAIKGYVRVLAWYIKLRLNNK